MPYDFNPAERALVEYANYVAQDTGLTDLEVMIIFNSLLDYVAGQEVYDAICAARNERTENA